MNPAKEDEAIRVNIINYKSWFGFKVASLYAPSMTVLRTDTELHREVTENHRASYLPFLLRFSLWYSVVLRIFSV